MLYSKKTQDKKDEAEENHKCAFLSLCLPWIAGLLLRSEVAESCLWYIFSCYVVSINTLTVIALVSTATVRRNKQWNRGRVFRVEFTEAITAISDLFFAASVIICWSWRAARFLCVYRWVHSPPAPCAACRPCGKSPGWSGCTGRRWEGQRGSSLCCRYLCCPWKPAAQRHDEVRRAGGRRDASCGICCSWLSQICWSCEHDTLI